MIQAEPRLYGSLRPKIAGVCPRKYSDVTYGNIYMCIIMVECLSLYIILFLSGNMVTERHFCRDGVRREDAYPDTV